MDIDRNIAYVTEMGQMYIVASRTRDWLKQFHGLPSGWPQFYCKSIVDRFIQ